MKDIENLDSLISEFQNKFVGLWRFREYGKKPKFCVTYTMNGYYYDTTGHDTPIKALKAAIGISKRIKDNAHLIAAAPKMLKALKEVEKEMILFDIPIPGIITNAIWEAELKGALRQCKIKRPL